MFGLIPCVRRRRLLLLIGLSLLAGCNRAEGERIQVDGVEAQVEIAVTPEQRRRGLMHRESLGQDQGMLLVFSQQKRLKLWMLNTSIPLDVGFFNREGRLVDLISMDPDGGGAIHQSRQPALYALEMNRGWFRRNGIAIGARLQLPRPVRGR